MKHMLAIACTIGVAMMVTSTARGEIKTKSIEYTVDGTKHIGYLAWDDSSNDKRPGVLIVHEWWGLTDYPKHRAEMLAKLGYVAFCADMYGEGKQTSDPKQAQQMMSAAVKDPDRLFKIFQASLEQLRAQSSVDTKRVAAIGYCFGGGCCLNAARAGADLAGVVSFHGSLDPAKGKAKKGEIKAKILVCHGADDSFESPESIAAFQNEMRDAGVDWQMNIYSGAVHAFTNPNADKFGIPGIAYNPEADHRSWAAMTAFFKEIFKSE